MIATDLRINNYVKCKISNDAGIYQVTGIDGWRRIFASKEDERIYKAEGIKILPRNKYKAPVYHDERLIRITGGARDNEVYIESKIGGVRLDEEWLDRLGFEKRGVNDISYFIVIGKPSKSNGLFIEIELENYSASIGQLKHFSHQFGEYKFVHQVQNFYHSFSGTELTIKD